MDGGWVLDKECDPAQLLPSIDKVKIALPANCVLVTRHVLDMQRTSEKRYPVKFCIKLKKFGLETLNLIKEAYGEEAMP